MKTVLTKGSEWPLLTIDDSEQLKDIDNVLKFGNHKGANQQHQELLLKLVKDDVVRGFALPLPLDKIKKIPGILLAPLNIQLQKTTNECGEIIPKNRLTKDQSWNWQSGTLVNSRVGYFGKALKQLIYWAVAARKLHTKRKSLLPSWA
jgi:hypothetical protein